MSNILNLLSEKAIENINESFGYFGWIDDSDDLPERERDMASHKAIKEYAEANDLDYQDLIWDYFPQLDDIVGDYLKSNFKSVYDDNKFYFYENKYDFKTVEELEKFFNI